MCSEEEKCRVQGPCAGRPPRGPSVRRQGGRPAENPCGIGAPGRGRRRTGSGEETGVRTAPLPPGRGGMGRTGGGSRAFPLPARSARVRHARIRPALRHVRAGVGRRGGSAMTRRRADPGTGRQGARPDPVRTSSDVRTDPGAACPRSMTRCSGGCRSALAADPSVLPRHRPARIRSHLFQKDKRSSQKGKGLKGVLHACRPGPPAAREFLRVPALAIADKVWQKHRLHLRPHSQTAKTDRLFARPPAKPCRSFPARQAVFTFSPQGTGARRRIRPCRSTPFSRAGAVSASICARKFRFLLSVAPAGKNFTVFRWENSSLDFRLQNFKLFSVCRYGACPRACPFGFSRRIRALSCRQSADALR